MLEAEAILEGIKNVVDTCNRERIPLVVELNALGVIKVMNGEEEDLPDLKSITDFISTIAASAHKI